MPCRVLLLLLLSCIVTVRSYMKVTLYTYSSCLASHFPNQLGSFSRPVDKRELAQQDSILIHKDCSESANFKHLAANSGFVKLVNSASLVIDLPCLIVWLGWWARAKMEALLAPFYIHGCSKGVGAQDWNSF